MDVPFQKRKMKIYKKPVESKNTPSFYPPSPSPSPSPPSPSPAITGTCRNLEKDYYRITGAIDPSTVRPLAVLEQALSTLKAKWKEGVDYEYVRQQFKSIRQDITIQHLKNDFVAEVYETHARIALEQGDLDEFTQCQSQLFHLYSLNISPANRIEFLSYKILFHLVRRKNQENNLLSPAATLRKMSEQEIKHPFIRHALAVQAAMIAGNYIRFFHLYRTAPNMSMYLMDFLVTQVREEALERILIAFKPTYFVDDLMGLLAFSSLQSTLKFLQTKGIPIRFEDDRAMIDMEAMKQQEKKDSSAALFFAGKQKRKFAKLEKKFNNYQQILNSPTVFPHLQSKAQKKFKKTVKKMKKMFRFTE